MAANPDVVELARQLGEDLLFPSAPATDAADSVPAGHLDALAHAGLYGLFGPEEAGGLGVDVTTACRVIEALSGGCLATAFVWLQHHGAVRAVAGAAPTALRDQWLGPLCRGEQRAGVVLAGLLPGPARLRATPVGEGWVLEGTSPWVSGWGLVDVLHVAARAPGGEVVWLLVDGVDQPGLSVERQRLVAADASVTVRLGFSAVEVAGDRLVKTEPYRASLYGARSSLRMNGYLALGVAARCCRLMGPSALDVALVACRRTLDDSDSKDVSTARAAGAELAMKAAGALVVHEGSGSILAGRHPQRLAREALFLLVFGTRPAIRSELLERLSQSVGP